LGKILKGEINQVMNQCFFNIGVLGHIWSTHMNKRRTHQAHTGMEGENMGFGGAQVSRFLFFFFDGVMDFSTPFFSPLFSHDRHGWMHGSGIIGSLLLSPSLYRREPETGSCFISPHGT